jgi:hypothetical protein
VQPALARGLERQELALVNRGVVLLHDTRARTANINTARHVHHAQYAVTRVQQ